MKQLFRAVAALALALALAAGPGVSPARAESPARPNIVFILIDDLGWTDVGCFGSTYYETPSIDRLATQGMKFTNAYASCTVCSPTRASILTGRYPARLHITDWIAGHVRPFAKLKVPDWTMELSPEVPNIARALKEAGYATASIGKWHLGPARCWPEKQGFDLNIGGCQMGQPPTYFSPYKIPTLPDGPKGEFLSDRLAAEAIRFIERNEDRPFFLYLPHYAVHQPVQARPEVVAKYQARAKADPNAAHHNPQYAALVESVDDSVGRVLDKLEELKLAEKTIVVFTSDNGGLIGTTSNAPLRAGKGSAYEGGVRVPLIVKWPGVVRPGAVCDVPVISADFYPTFLAVAGASAPASHPVDGENLEPLWRQSGKLNRDALYWHYPHYHPGGAAPYSAIREGDYRLVEYFEDGRVELYNLGNDIGEAHDLAAELPDRTAALKEKLHAWRRKVGAQTPSPNPNADAEKDQARPRKKQ